jgi:hypothetical protein
MINIKRHVEDFFKNWDGNSFLLGWFLAVEFYYLWDLKFNQALFFGLFFPTFQLLIRQLQKVRGNNDDL